jgi:hypothetical protein
MAPLSGTIGRHGEIVAPLLGTIARQAATIAPLSGTIAPLPFGAAVGMQLIILPGCRVLLDVPSDVVQRRVVADDMFTVMALPCRYAADISGCVDALGDRRFVGTDDGG